MSNDVVNHHGKRPHSTPTPSEPPIIDLTGGGPFPNTACWRCRKKKIKCDAKTPVCSACIKANVECKLANSSDNRIFDRGYVAELQESIKKLQAEHDELERKLEATRLDSSRDPMNPEKASNVSSLRNLFSGRRELIPNQHSSTTEFVGEENAMGFIKLILAKIRTETKNTLYMMHTKSGQSRPRTSAANISLPLDVELGRSLMDAYLRRGHPRHPFLPYSVIVTVCEKVIMSQITQAEISEDERFRAFCIFAIGAVYKIQERKAQYSRQPSEDSVDPSALFAVAMQGGTMINFLSGLDGLQNLLLVSRFGLFSQTGAGLWEISSLCVQNCIELGLHRPPVGVITAYQEQIQRRVFWQCHNLNTHSSTTLGLPFGIADSDITVKEIVDIEDEQLLDATEPLDTIASSLTPQGIGSLTLMISQSRLRRISSGILRDFKNLKVSNKPPNFKWNGGSLEVGEISTSIWSLYIQYSEKLSNWRAQYPKPYSGNPTGSSGQDSYFTNRWRDLHYFQEKLLLIRCAIENSSSMLVRVDDPLDLTNELYEAASSVIKLYAEVLDEGSMEPTPGRLYRILTAGLSVLFTVVMELQSHRISVDKAVKKSHSRSWLESRVSTLKLCRDTLSGIWKQSTNEDATLKHMRYFELLSREVLRNFVVPALQKERSGISTPAVANHLNRTATFTNGGGNNTREERNSDSSETLFENMLAPTKDGLHYSSITLTTPVIEEDRISASNESIESQSMFSPVSWFDNPNAGYDFAELTCLATKDHFQPCYCALISADSTSNVDELAMPFQSASQVGDFDFDQAYGMNSTDGFYPSDWGDIFEGSMAFEGILF